MTWYALAAQGGLDQGRVGDGVDLEVAGRQGGLHDPADGVVVVQHQDADLAGAVEAARLTPLHLRNAKIWIAIGVQAALFPTGCRVMLTTEDLLLSSVPSNQSYLRAGHTDPEAPARARHLPLSSARRRTARSRRSGRNGLGNNSVLHCARSDASMPSGPWPLMNNTLTAESTVASRRHQLVSRHVRHEAVGQHQAEGVVGRVGVVSEGFWPASRRLARNPSLFRVEQTQCAGFRGSSSTTSTALSCCLLAASRCCFAAAVGSAGGATGKNTVATVPPAAATLQLETATVRPQDAKQLGEAHSAVVRLGTEEQFAKQPLADFRRRVRGHCR